MSYRIKPTLKPIKSVSKVPESWLSRKTGLHPERIQLFWALAIAASGMIFLAYATHKYFEVFEYNSPVGYMEITPKEFYGPRIPESILKKLKSEVIPKKVYAAKADHFPDVGKKTDSIEQKILDKFGKDGRIMLAICRGEACSNPSAENMGRAKGRYQGECSIGIFQINLKKDGCRGKKVHWDKVKGETLDEKIAWLKNVDNNIEVAYQIYQASGFTPWSAYTSKKYLKYIVSK